MCELCAKAAENGEKSPTIRETSESGGVRIYDFDFAIRKHGVGGSERRGEMKKLLLALVLFAGSSSIVSAQMLCVDRVDMLNRLASEYGEELIEVKMMEEHGLLEVLKSRSKGTWTLLLTKPGGISCVLATGKGLDTDEEDLNTVEYEL